MNLFVFEFRTDLLLQICIFTMQIDTFYNITNFITIEMANNNVLYMRFFISKYELRKLKLVQN
jgi:hypothetical protein